MKNDNKCIFLEKAELKKTVNNGHLKKKGIERLSI